MAYKELLTIVRGANETERHLEFYDLMTLYDIFTVLNFMNISICLSNYDTWDTGPVPEHIRQ